MNRWQNSMGLCMGLLMLSALAAGGCTEIRTTDPPRTATEQFLMSTATNEAIRDLSLLAIGAETLRDRSIFVEPKYLFTPGLPTNEQLQMIAELRSRLLESGMRLAEVRDKAEIVLEVRSGGIGIDRLEFLLGIPGVTIPLTGVSGISTPELAIIKSTKQRGYSSIAYVAFWNDTGEIIASSNPRVGKTYREDWWFFGVGPRTLGDIPPAEPE